MKHLILLPILGSLLVWAPILTEADEAVDKRLKALQGRMASECIADPGADCIAIQERAVALSRDIYGKAGDETLDAMSFLASLYQANGRDSDAERLYRDVLHLSRQSYEDWLAASVAPAPIKPLASPQEALLGRLADGEPSQIRALLANPELKAKMAQMEQVMKALPAEIARANPMMAELQQQGPMSKQEQPSPRALIGSLSKLGDFYMQQERLAEAEPLLVEALALQRAVHVRGWAEAVADSERLATIVRMQQQAGEEDANLGKLTALRQAIDDGAVDPEPLIKGLTKLGELHVRQERPADAEPLFAEARQLRERAPRGDGAGTLAQLAEMESNLADDDKTRLQRVLGHVGAHERREDRMQAIAQNRQLAATKARLGHYDEAEALYEHALANARDLHGETSAEVLNIVNELAAIQVQQGHLPDAEASYQTVIAAVRERPRALVEPAMAAVAGLTALYERQGRQGEREQLLAEINQLAAATFGSADPESLLSPGDMVASNPMPEPEVQAAGSGEIDDTMAMMQDFLKLNRNVLGEGQSAKAGNVMDALQVLAPLAQGQAARGDGGQREAVAVLRDLFKGQGDQDPMAMLAGQLETRIDAGSCEGSDAAALEQATERQAAALGEADPQTSMCLLHLARGYVDAGRHEEAQALLPRAEASCRASRQEAFLPLFVSCLFALADLHGLEGDRAKAEALYKDGLESGRQIRSPFGVGETAKLKHPFILPGLNGLAELYAEQRRIGETEPLYAEALEHLASMAITSPMLGDDANPQILITRLRHASALAALDRIDEAVAELRLLEAKLLAWTGVQLAGAAAVDEKREYLKQRQDFQNLVLTLATTYPEHSLAIELASDVILRWKQFQSADDAFLAKLARTHFDPDIRAAAGEIAELSGRLAKLAHGKDNDNIKAAALLKTLQDKERELARLSAPYKRHLAVGRATLSDVRAVAPIGSALIEFRHYKPRNLRTGEDGEHRWAAMLIQGDGAPVLQDLGSVKETRALLADLLQRGDAGLADRAAAALYQQLFAPMVSKADDARLIYVALDGMLGLMPIERLMLADGRYWSDVQNLRFLQTGRGLLESEGSTATGEGLLALGGVDFELASSTLLLASIAPAAGHEAEDAGEALQRATSEARGQLKPFAPLNGTAEEIDAITAAYGQLRRDELLTIWRGADATEVALKQVGEGGAAVPEVLHLATHGFFLEGTGDELGRPELDSGVALAGANRAIRGEAASGEDGILYSLEAQRLNLEGTKLVVLSACDTAKGKVDYSEGVVGLVRALQIAGAENVLMTLWPLEDAKARDFMTRFYQIWLAEQDRSPAEALAMTKAHFKKDLSWQPWHWAPYVLIEG